NIFTPVIRQQVREQVITNKGHYTVYLPAYDDKRLIKRLTEFKDIQWDVFSKHNKKVVKHKNVFIQPIDNEAFIKSMAESAGVLCGGGFETPAEALFMQKKLLVIPMKNQYEQQLNAAMLKEMGVPVIKSLKPKHNDVIFDWLISGKPVKVNYPDSTQQILDMVFQNLKQVPD
ncbi:MAG: glycosyltransferase family protein, partial [Mucilaginibacter sp.]